MTHKDNSDNRPKNRSNVSETCDNISVRVFDAADAPTVAAATAEDIEPKETFETHNTTRDEYHETIIDGLNGTTPDLTVDALALGDSTAATTDIAAGSPLGNELFRTSPTDTIDNGQTFVATIFLDSTEANGNNFEEAALIAEQSNGDDLSINRFLIDDPGDLLSPKTSNETATIDIEITQQDA
jgi:hypothetical protein